MVEDAALLVHRVPSVDDEAWICLQLPKGVLLLLTSEEFMRALKRGKTVRRKTERDRRVAKIQAQMEAATLKWIAE